MANLLASIAGKISDLKGLDHRALELPPIGWQLFILGSSQSYSTAFPTFLDTCATRLLAEPLRRYRACYCTVTWGLHDILSTGGPGLGIRRTNLPRCRARVHLGKL